MNKYQVKIKEYVVPGSFTYDELLANGFLNKSDDQILIKMVEESEWRIAHEYPFPPFETQSGSSFKNIDSRASRNNLENMSDSYSVLSHNITDSPSESIKPHKQEPTGDTTPQTSTYGSWAGNFSQSAQAPTPQPNPSRPPRPDSNLVWAIISLTLCLPFGVASLVQSLKVDTAYDNGDYEASQQASRDAKKWAKWTFYAWIILIILFVILIFLAESY